MSLKRQWNLATNKASMKPHDPLRTFPEEWERPQIRAEAIERGVERRITREQVEHMKEMARLEKIRKAEIQDAADRARFAMKAAEQEAERFLRSKGERVGKYRGSRGILFNYERGEE